MTPQNPPVRSEHIRIATAEDLVSIRQVHVEAFGGRAEEANLVDLLHAANKARPSLVAVCDGRVVAHVVFSPVSIEPANDAIKIAGLGPIGVLPEFQHRGIGSRLVRAGIEACQQDQFDAVVVLGDPHLYSRFGFQSAMNYGLTNEYVADGHFMIRELRGGAMSGVKGLLKYAPEFRAAGC